MASSPIFAHVATPSPAVPSSPDTKLKARTAKRLKKMEKAMEDHEEDIKTEIANLREGFEELERRRQMDSVRAAVRHEIIFSALKTIHEEIGKLKEDKEPPAGASPRIGSKQQQEGRKNLEQCIAKYTQDMERGVRVEQVKVAGKLCASYSEALFKTYI